MSFDRYLAEYEDRDWETDVDGTVRIAMIGLGWWTVEYAMPAVENADYCETTAVVSSSTEKAERVAEDAATVERALTYDEFHEGVGADAFDAVYVCTPNALHLQYVETAADLGKAVLCEKPMEASVERAEQMVEVVESADVPLMVAYRMQTEPVVRLARELVREGFVGDPVHVHGNMSQDLFAEDADSWRLNPDLAGPGASVTDLGVYSINTTRFILDAEPVAASAWMYAENDAFDDVPDERSAFLVEFEGGVGAACTASQHADEGSHLRITGTEGEIDIEPAFLGECGVTLSRGGTTTAIDPAGVDEMEEEFDYFANRLLAGEPHHPDGRHGLVDMRAIEAVYEAAERGERVEIA